MRIGPMSATGTGRVGLPAGEAAGEVLCSADDPDGLPDIFSATPALGFGVLGVSQDPMRPSPTMLRANSVYSRATCSGPMGPSS